MENTRPSYKDRYEVTRRILLAAMRLSGNEKKDIDEFVDGLIETELNRHIRRRESMDSTGMTLEQVKAHLRKKYGFFECPKKSDRLFLTELHWQQMDWTDKEKYVNAALPHKMWNMRSDDQIWPWCKTFRGETAYGHQAGPGHDKYFPILPKLVKGRGIARWMTERDTSIIEIDLFKDYSKEWTPDNIPDKIEAIERQSGQNYEKQLILTKQELLSAYAPTALQKFSKKSKLLRDPKHQSWHYMIDKNETYHDQTDAKDKVAFVRHGWRWDSWDGYFIKNATFIGLTWN